MLTQIVRYGRMMKVDFTRARCKVTANWSSAGSVSAGTISSKCHGVEIEVEIESSEDAPRIAALLRNAEGGCYAQATVQQAVPVTGIATLNGEAFDYATYPRRVSRR